MTVNFCFDRRVYTNLFINTSRSLNMRKILDFKPFVPSNDYATSKAFYACMGFEINWDDGEVCEIDTMKR